MCFFVKVSEPFLYGFMEYGRRSLKTNGKKNYLPIDVAVGKNINCPVDGSRTSWKPTGGIGIGTIDSTGSDAKI